MTTLGRMPPSKRAPSKRTEPTRIPAQKQKNPGIRD